MQFQLPPYGVIASREAAKQSPFLAAGDRFGGCGESNAGLPERLHLSPAASLMLGGRPLLAPIGREKGAR